MGGIAHAVGVPPAGPTSISLHSVEPWSNTQLCPPPVSGWVGSLSSETELSGMKIDWLALRKTPGDQVDRRRLSCGEAAGGEGRAVRAYGPGEVLAEERESGRGRNHSPCAL